MAAHNSNSRASERQLPPALQLHILSLLPPNDRALSGRLMSPDAAAGLSKDPTCTASLSQPLPPHAVPWAVEAGQHHVRQLPFRHKLQLLCTAATSGSEVNLEVALALLQQSVFPEVLQSLRDVGATRSVTGTVHPGVAAIKAGHPQLLGWLLRRCPSLVDPHTVLAAAALHCDNAGLAVALGALDSIKDGADSLLDVARRSATPDTTARVAWMLDERRGNCSQLWRQAVAAARSGDLSQLRRLREQGCPMCWEDFGGQQEPLNEPPPMLEHSLEHADLAAVQWLVDEAGVELPEATKFDGDGEPYVTEEWIDVLHAAAKGADGLAKLQWLQQRGAPPVEGRDWQVLAQTAAKAGRLELVQHVVSTMGADNFEEDIAGAAAASGRIELVKYLQQAGFAFAPEAYEAAAGPGNVEVVRWLAEEAGAPVAGINIWLLIGYWPRKGSVHSRDVLQAVQLLVGQAGCRVLDARMALLTAARRGELALVQYLLQQTPEYQPGWEVLVTAADSSCEALLEWLVEQHPRCLEVVELQGLVRGVSPYMRPAVNGDLGTLTALWRLGVPWGAGDVVLQAAVQAAGMQALRWLAERGAPVGLASPDAWFPRCLVRADVEAWLRDLAAAAAPAAAAATGQS